MPDLTDFLNVVASAEDWAGFGADGRGPEEPMKRFTIDVLRDLLEREFPETSGQFRLPL
jgi:alkanesulfonate monooxygenase SsuD/methylene tetrahydromethanopterin reductase-like flavin-dependent oxidoreductase (luciferase family)